MIVQALRRHRALGEARAIGAMFHVDPATAKHLAGVGLARLVAGNEEWHAPYGRDLRTEPLTDRPWPAVVACLNIWNDRPALERTLPLWVSRVDALVVADGSYRGVSPAGPSTDGLAAYLSTLALPCRWVTRPGPWPDQNTKRSALLQAATAWHPTGLLLIVDADEFLAAEGDLHHLPECDVGWVTVTSPMYQRPYGQPRLFRARDTLTYRGRHHWLYTGTRLLATHQYGGPGFEHRLTGLFLRNERGLMQDAARWRLKSRGQVVQVAAEAPATTGATASDARAGARAPLRLTQTTTYDPGLVAFRLHTAINSTTPHASVFLRRGDDNPFAAPRQLDADQEPDVTRRFLRDADVVHCHLDTTVLDSFGVTPKALVLHHHGTMLRQRAADFAADPRPCLRLVSNLELLSYGSDLHWLPNPVNVARLRRLRAQNQHSPTTFRVAHSPSKRHLKGTEVFLAVCATLQQGGVAVEPVLIEGKAHSEALRMKASCDACFDSFWLGIQCSGLEAAAMGLPVVAGDGAVADHYRDLLGQVPYTYANDAAALAQALERLATDPDWCHGEAERVAAYVLDWHDDAAVTLRYLDLLDTAIGWRARLTRQVPAR